jgi:hypothetical protein
LYLEPPSNSFDAESKNVVVTLIRKPRSPFVEFTCEDDGEGFSDIRLSYTFYADTTRRSDSTKRGRFTVGEKVFFSICEKGMIETGDKRITFDEKGRHVGTLRTPRRGTLVRGLVRANLGEEDVVANKLRSIITPDGVSLRVNEDHVFRHDVRIPRFRATFDSPIKTEGGSFKIKARETEVRLYSPSDFGEPKVGYLYELGMPVQPIECPYDVNILQKVPLSQERDMVSDRFLQDVYAEVLNVVIDELSEDKVADTWVRIAVADSRCKDEVVAKVKEKRFGKKVAFMSPNKEANEKALAEGYHLIYPRTLGEDERERFKAIGVLSTGDIFGREPAPADYVEPNEDMLMIAEYAKALAKELTGKDIRVEFFKQFENPDAADYGTGLLNRDTLSFNISRLGYAWFKQGKTPEVTALIVHELPHEAEDPDFAHGHVYVRRLGELAGKLPFLALEKPEIFR